MSEDELEKIMVANYSRIFREMLLASFKSNKKVSPDYLGQPIERQREVEKEISRVSGEMAKALVSKLKRGGYLTTEPKPQKLRALIKETLGDFGVKE